MNITVVTAFDFTWREVGSLCSSKLEPYCRSHGYNLVKVVRTLDPSRPFAWSKIRALQQALPGSDWVVWMDADTLICNHEKRLEDFLENTKANLLIARDWNGENTGVFMLRNCPWSEAFLAEWDQTASIVPHLWDNGAFRALWQNPDTRANTKVFEQQHFNAYPFQYMPGMFLVHFAGHQSPREKLRLMLQFMWVTDNWHEPVRCRLELPLLWEKRGYKEGVEIGTQAGDFAEVMLDNWNNGKLHLVDPWAHLEEYVDNANVSDEKHEQLYRRVLGRFNTNHRVSIHRKTSVDAAREIGTVDFAYIDGDHSYEGVKTDIATWWPKVRRGGVLAGHDYLDGTVGKTTFGVKSAVDEFVAANPGMKLFVTREEWWKSWYITKTTE